jgi:hypothetical protein
MRNLVVKYYFNIISNIISCQRRLKMARRRNLTPQAIAAKQIRRAREARQDYIDGIESVQQSPGVTLADNQESLIAMRTNWVNAMDTGYIAARLREYDFGRWKTKTKTRGADNWVAGIALAEPEITRFQVAFTPVRRQVSDTVRQMPNASFEQRLERMLANARGLHNNRYRPRRNMGGG